MKGSVPGAPGTILRVKDALTQKWTRFPPFPTFTPDATEVIPPIALRVTLENPFKLNPDLKSNYYITAAEEQLRTDKEAYDAAIAAGLPPPSETITEGKSMVSKRKLTANQLKTFKQKLKKENQIGAANKEDVLSALAKARKRTFAG